MGKSGHQKGVVSQWDLLFYNNALLCFPGGSDGKEAACNAGDLGSIPGSGRSPGKGNGNPLQYVCLRNPMEREAWQATGPRVARVGHNLVTKPPPPLLLIK